MREETSEHGFQTQIGPYGLTQLTMRRESLPIAILLTLRTSIEEKSMEPSKRRSDENRGRFLRFTRFLLLTGKLISAGKCFELKKEKRKKKEPRYHRH